MPPLPPRRPPFRQEAPSGPRVNDRIRITPIRLIDENGEMVGVVETDDARRRASELGLDLVEVAPDVRPPVCKIMDFGKYKYELSKKEKAGRSKTKSSEVKEVRLGRSMKIDPHDVGIRVAQARRFLIEGHKVVIVQNFKGRELAHRDRGDQRMEAIIQQLSDLGRVEMSPRLNGKRMSMIITPDRARVEMWLRKEQQKSGGPAAAPGAAGPAGAAGAPGAAEAAGAPADAGSPTSEAASADSKTGTVAAPAAEAAPAKKAAKPAKAAKAAE